MISHRSTIHPLTKLLLVVHRSSVTRSHLTLVDQVKQLYDRKQYEGLLRLFDEQVKQGHAAQLPQRVFVKVLQTGAQLQDLSRAVAIHQAIPRRLIDDPYVVPSLVHMFSEWDRMKTD